MTTIQPQHRIEQEQGTLLYYEHVFFVPTGAKNETTIQRLSQFEYQVRQNMEIFLDRNTAYGDAFLIGGVEGCVHELLGCMVKLVVLSLQAPQAGKPNKEKIINALRDMANYAVMSLILIAMNRWEVKL